MEKSPKIKRKAILFYNDVGNPFVRAFLYENDARVDEKEFDLPPYRLEGGAIKNEEALASDIKAAFPSIDELYLILSLEETFKGVTSLPKMNVLKAYSLLRKDLKDSFPNYKKNYLAFTSASRHPLGTIYYTYFIPLKVVECFRKVAAALGTKLKGVDLYSHYLATIAGEKEEKGTACLAYEKGIATLALSYGPAFVSGVSLACSSPTDLNKGFLAYLSRHEMELEKKPIEQIFAFGEAAEEAEKLGYGVTIFDQDPDVFASFSFRGIKL